MDFKNLYRSIIFSFELWNKGWLYLNKNNIFYFRLANKYSTDRQTAGQSVPLKCRTGIFDVRIFKSRMCQVTPINTAAKKQIEPTPNPLSLGSVFLGTLFQDSLRQSIVFGNQRPQILFRV